MSHPLVEQIPDPMVKRAVSDMFDGGYTFRYSVIYDTYPDEPAFPPQPMHTDLIMAAYLQKITGRVEVRRQAVALSEPGKLPSREVVGVYKELIEPLQQAAPLLDQGARAGGVFSEYGGLQEYYMDKVMRENRVLVTAFVAGRLASNGAWVSGLGYPRSVHQEIPLQMRDAVVPYLNRIAEIRKSFDDPFLEEMEKRAQPLVRLDVVTKELGAVVAASFLPTAQQLDAWFAGRSK